MSGKITISYFSFFLLVSKVKKRNKSSSIFDEFMINLTDEYTVQVGFLELAFQSLLDSRNFESTSLLYKSDFLVLPLQQLYFDNKDAHRQKRNSRAGAGSGFLKDMRWGIQKVKKPRIAMEHVSYFS